MRSFFLLLVLLIASVGVLPAGASDFANALEAGRKLYTVKCARCHKFYDPAKYSDEAWHTWMDKMSRKAKLQPDQKQIFSEYLETFRTRTNTAAAPEH
jgi:cytochrome c553